MTTHTVDPTAFRAAFPEFVALADSAVLAYAGMASASMTTDDGALIYGATLDLALQLMTAHMARLMVMAAAGKSGAPVTSASEGAVSVSMVAPPVRSAWGYWLSQTPYGQQLLSLLQVAGAGGLLIGGLPERAAFRKVGGVW